MGYLWRSDNATRPATTILEATYDALKNTRVFGFDIKVYKLLGRYSDSLIALSSTESNARRNDHTVRLLGTEVNCQCPPITVGYTFDCHLATQPAEKLDWHLDVSSSRAWRPRHIAVIDRSTRSRQLVEHRLRRPSRDQRSVAQETRQTRDKSFFLLIGQL